MAFHVNPKTGNAGACRAFHGRCPFGGAEEHFEDKADAQKAFEKKQEKFEHFLWKTKLPATKGSYVLATYDPMSEEVPVGALWGNPVYGEFLKKLEEAEDKTRLVIENGQIWEKNNIYGETSWKFVYGNYDNISRLEPKKTYDVAWLGRTIQTHGARLENGGTMPKMSVEHLRDIYPNDEQINEEAVELKRLFNYKNPAAEEQALREQLQDHITERWSGLSPQQWELLRPQLENAVGEPLNIGTDSSPRWVWPE